MTTLDDALGFARENWRILLLVFLMLGSAVAIFAPSSQRDAPTNMQYGLELDGGTRLRAPLVGMHADVDSQGMNQTAIQNATEGVAERLDVDEADVKFIPREGAMEIYTEEVSQDEFRAAMEAEGLAPGEVQDGVTRTTRQEARDVIADKIGRSPDITGGTVTIARSGGDNYIVVEVPDTDEQELLDLIGQPGRVEVVAVFPESSGGPTTGTPTPTPNGTVTATPTDTTTPTDTPTGTAPNAEAAEYTPPDGYRAVTLLTKPDLQQIGDARENSEGDPAVDVTLTDDAGREFADALQEYGFTNEGQGQCSWRADPENPGYCLVVVRNGEPVSGYGLAPDLADIINNGEFTKTNSFQLIASNMSEARAVQIDLRAGAIPTRLAIEEGSITYIGPAQATQFKLYSLITGVIAALAISGAIFVRYREPKVALPMWLTALSEVFLLLGFAAAIQLPLDLAHMAGFIAVIGTGVDDLVIIADEVMSQGEIKTRRVFQSRFRKAFWVIGAAAITTIIAMSPLAVLSLGDLSGFAVVTIVGVLIGVLVTRPAYGDILRALVTGEED